MRVSGKRQVIDRWINGWLCSTDFQREKIKFEIKFKDINKYKRSTHFTFSVLFVSYKRGEVFMMNETEKLLKGSLHKENLFIVHNIMLLMTAKETINWMRPNGYLHIWMIPLNVLRDGTPCSVLPVGNIPEFVPLDNWLNREILHSLCIHKFLSCYIIDGEGTDEEKRDVCFVYSTPR